MKLYMIRHGESTANAEKRHAGWAQIPLTEKGRSDALRAKKILSGVKLDKIFVSDLLRAKQTLEIALPGAKGIETPLLREICVGELAGLLITEAAEKYGSDYAENRAARNFLPYGGENMEMHESRIRAFKEMLEENEASAVAAFCHEGSIRHMLKLVRGETPTEELLHNGSVSIFEYRDGKWSCLAWDQMGE